MKKVINFALVGELIFDVIDHSVLTSKHKLTNRF